MRFALSQRLLRPLAFDRSPDLGTNVGHDIQQLLIGSYGFGREEFQHGRNLCSYQDRESEPRSDSNVCGFLRSREVRILGDVRDPSRFPTRQNPTWQTDFWAEVGGLAN